MAREITAEDERADAVPVTRRRRRRGPSLLAFFNLLVYSLAAVALVLVYLPREDAPAPSGDPIDVANFIGDADAEALPEVVLTEEAMNGFLGRTLLPVDAGTVSRAVTHGRAWLRFHDGGATVFLERRIFGHGSTLSVDIELEASGEGRQLTIKGGRFGRLPVPQGMLRLVLPAFASLKDAYPKEIAAILAAKKITFAPGKMILSL